MINEIILYRADELASRIEVRIEDETVWLTQSQMSNLFETTRNNITLHISNVFKEKELVKNSVCKDSLLTASDGKKYKTKLYNLDVIISVGYRVKSKQGTAFRIWANKVLKDYLLKGYSLNNRMNRIENNMDAISKKVNEIDLQLNINLPTKQGIFFDGQIFDAYTLACNIIKQATKSVIVIDNYIDETVLTLLSKRNQNVVASIYTKPSKQLKLDIDKHNQQYPQIQIKSLTKSHDRFIILDQKVVYHLGASLKDLGKKWFAFSKMEMDAKEILRRLEN